MQKLNKPTVADRQKAFQALIEKESHILYSKGADYTAGKKNEDAYANFRLIAMLLEGCPITPYTIAMIYKLKHVFSLITFCKTGRQESGEDLEDRHMDDRNYTFILNELVPDHLNYFEKGDDAKETDACIDEDYYDDRPTHLYFSDIGIGVSSISSPDCPSPIHHI